MGERPGMTRAVGTAILLTILLAPMPALRGQSAQRPRKPAPPAEKTDPAAGDEDQPSTPSGDAATTPRAGGLRMSRAVVCKSIDSFEVYTPLPGAAQTSDEKLLIYYRPYRYKIEQEDDGYYRAHLVQDNEIRRRGRKEILRQKRKVVDYAPKTKEPLRSIFIRNTISLKGLEPGDYDLTIILHDELDKTAPPSRQVVKFRVIPPADPRSRAVAGKKSDPFPER